MKGTYEAEGNNDDKVWRGRETIKRQDDTSKGEPFHDSAVRARRMRKRAKSCWWGSYLTGGWHDIQEQVETRQMLGSSQWKCKTVETPVE